MAVSTIYTHFHFKANHLRDLQNTAEDKPIRVEVVKIIALTQAQYQHFFSHLLEDMPFISANRELMGGGSDGVTRCLLVTTRNIKGGLLVDGQGYDYARYTAEVPDKSVLDLREVPTDHYDLTLQQPRPGPER